ncbi:hypothetical protein AFL01nite_03330 [Aeromicrobium flavum]|uniref:Peptidase M15C domain-containing protein n=1 Tax=Aeromicrobium flavum TaxID=416568 RepID=A0A512HRE4_9ACTN|nr:M15 family metallopeptidase [Aeromicrobium flavum]GEO88006.1 hypothetical protein AFL01nite_03330 [Aeromicrobium flavum]
MPQHRRVTIAALALTLLAGCGITQDDAPAPPRPSRSVGTSSSPESTATATTAAPRIPPPSRVREVPPEQWKAIVDAGMVRRECPIQRREQLRRVDLSFVDFDGRTRRGHLIVNADVAPSVRRIFDRLFAEEFPIRKMKGVEAYGGDVAKSLAADNTSAFNCRRADQINAPFTDSPHANGRAVDINPLQNPWVDLRCDCWTPSARHAERTPGRGKILERGLVWRLFTREGWVWQNIDVPDYMHFDTGYPSRPFSGR